jgi:hypothetical protein
LSHGVMLALCQDIYMGDGMRVDKQKLLNYLKQEYDVDLAKMLAFGSLNGVVEISNHYMHMGRCDIQSRLINELEKGAFDEEEDDAS